MESANVFNLQDAVENWLKTKRDKETILEQLHQSIGELRKLGLSDEEAFAVAKHRVDGSDYQNNETQTGNPDNVQIQRIVAFFFGIAAYLTVVYGILLLTHLLFFPLFKLVGSSLWFNLNLVRKIYYAIYIATPIVVYLLYRYRNSIIPYLKRKQFSLKTLIWTTVVFLLVLLGEKFSYELLKYNIPDYKYNISRYLLIQRDFKFFFPAIIIVSFIILYRFYRKKNYV